MTDATDARACHGAATTACRMSDMGHGQACRSCGMRVRDDLLDHPFFGFRAGCEHGASPQSLPAPVSEQA